MYVSDGLSLLANAANASEASFLFLVMQQTIAEDIE
jgi:hypothetical protein